VGIAQTLNIIFDLPQPFLGISQKKTPTSIPHNIMGK
jgi:hypothetical protein